MANLVHGLKSETLQILQNNQNIKICTDFFFFLLPNGKNFTLFLNLKD